MSNSPLVRYAKMSPNHSGKRTHAIDRITPHCLVLSQFSDTTTYPRRILIRVDFYNPLVSQIFS